MKEYNALEMEIYKNRIIEFQMAEGIYAVMLPSSPNRDIILIRGSEIVDMPTCSIITQLGNTMAECKIAMNTKTLMEI